MNHSEYMSSNALEQYAVFTIIQGGGHEMSGLPNRAEESVSYLVLSNTKDIRFEQALKASGLSSDSSDYFTPDYAVIVGYK